MRWVFLLLLLVRVAGAQRTANKHTIDVEVVASRLVYECEGHSSYCPVLHIKAVIEGHHYELVSERITPLLQREILELGNYKASLVKENTAGPTGHTGCTNSNIPMGRRSSFSWWAKQ